VARVLEELLEDRVHLAPVELALAHREITLQAAGEGERVVELAREARLQERAEGDQLDFRRRIGPVSRIALPTSPTRRKNATAVAANPQRTQNRAAARGRSSAYPENP